MNKRDPFCKNRINLEIALRLRLTMQILCHDRSEVPNKRAHPAYPNQPNRTEPPKILTEPYPTQPKPKPNLEWAWGMRETILLRWAKSGTVQQRCDELVSMDYCQGRQEYLPLYPASAKPPDLCYCQSYPYQIWHTASATIITARVYFKFQLPRPKRGI